MGDAPPGDFNSRHRSTPSLSQGTNPGATVRDVKVNEGYPQGCATSVTLKGIGTCSEQCHHRRETTSDGLASYGAVTRTDEQRHESLDKNLGMGQKIGVAATARDSFKHFESEHSKETARYTGERQAQNIFIEAGRQVRKKVMDSNFTGPPMIIPDKDPSNVVTSSAAVRKRSPGSAQYRRQSERKRTPTRPNCRREHQLHPRRRRRKTRRYDILHRRPDHGDFGQKFASIVEDDEEEHAGSPKKKHRPFDPAAAAKAHKMIPCIRPRPLHPVVSSSSCQYDATVGGGVTTRLDVRNRSKDMTIVVPPPTSRQTVKVRYNCFRFKSLVEAQQFLDLATDSQFLDHGGDAHEEQLDDRAGNDQHRKEDDADAPEE